MVREWWNPGRDGSPVPNGIEAVVLLAYRFG